MTKPAADPKADATKADTTKVDPVAEAPKAEAPKVDPVAEAPKAEAPKITLEIVDLPPDEEITVVVPHNYTLTRQNNPAQVSFKAGVQQMRKSDALHWWSVANGVKQYAPDPADGSAA